MIESLPNGTNTENEAEKSLWENLETSSLPDPTEFNSLLTEAILNNEKREEVNNILSKALGKEVAGVEIRSGLSENLSLYVRLKERNPEQKTEDFNLMLSKTEDGYDWTTALKYNGEK